jgi:hypothetical protein
VGCSTRFIVDQAASRLQVEQRWGRHVSMLIDHWEGLDGRTGWPNVQHRIAENGTDGASRHWLA